MAKPKGSTHLVGKARRESVILDVVAGFSLDDICKRANLKKTQVSDLIKLNRDRIQELINERLQAQQAVIDRFLEDETVSLMDVCKASSKLLEYCLTQHQKRIESGKTTTKEIRERRDNKWIKGIPSDDLELALLVWERTHNMLDRLQFKAKKAADDVANSGI